MSLGKSEDDCVLLMMFNSHLYGKCEEQENEGGVVGDNIGLSILIAVILCLVHHGFMTT